MTSISGRRFRRRAILGGGLMAAAGALLAACAPAPAASPTTAPKADTGAASAPAAKPAASKEVVTLGFASQYTGGTQLEDDKKLVGKFVAENPNIKVQFVERPAGGAQQNHDWQVTVYSAKDSSLDIASVDTGAQWPAEFAPAGWLEPIDDILPKNKQEKLMPQMIYQATHAGKIYALPWMNDVGVFYVRKDLLEQAGKKTPVTWQEMVETSKAMAKPPDMWGYIPCYRKDEQLTCNLQEYWWSNNADMTDKDGKVTINSPEVVDAIQFAIDLVKTHKITPEGVNNLLLDEGRQIFTEGKAVFHRNWGYAWQRAQSGESKIVGKVEMAKIPKWGPNGTHVTNLGGWSYVVHSASKKKDESKKLISWLGELPQQMEKYLFSGNPPAHMDAYTPESLAKYPPEIRAFAGPYFEVSKTAKSRPRHPQYREMSEIIQNEAQAAILGQKTAKAACDAMAQQLAPFLKDWKP